MIKKKSRLLQKIILAVSSVILTIALMESALRLAYPLYKDYNTEMWRYSTELKQRSDLPNLGHEHIPNKEAMLYGVEIKTNSLGLRYEKEYAVPKPKNTKRILVLGDSITMGWGVKYNETYSSILETLLNQDSTVKYEVINSGVGNYNSASELGALQKYLFLEPDIIVIGFYINDIEEIKYPKTNFITRNSYLYSFFLDKAITVEYTGQNGYQEYYHRLYKDDGLKGNLKKTLLSIVETAKSRKVPVIFVNIPEFHGFKEYEFQEVDDFIEKEIISANNLSTNELEYLNLLPVFKGKSIPAEELWVSKEDPHPNALGHRIIAQSLYPLISRSKESP